jgi:hypothetical protein
MNIDPQLYADPRFWISVISCVIAVVSCVVATVALFNAWQSRRIATRAINITEEQERRRQPRFDVHVVESVRRGLLDKQAFGFLVTISNPSDINNSISNAELQIDYVLNEAVKGSWRIPHQKQAGNLLGVQDSVSIPLRVDAHQSTKGWFCFTLSNAILDGRTIDTQKLLLYDTHGACNEREAISLKRIE